jgi:type I restriction-modification system DNA methylase subunit
MDRNETTRNNERVTKTFYTRFRKEHDTFFDFISGINDQSHKDQYTSLMLNRLMFCYFLQKQLFLNNDPEYLNNKFKLSKEKHGKAQHYSFYRRFLLTLFYKGFSQPVHSKAVKVIIGNIPFLNCSLFDVHEIENNKKIDIADKAFENIFNFFDSFQWTLEKSANSTGNEINPDVIGYIFEKYINKRAENGAYYTKEDITEYIGKNCIIPYLFDVVEQKCPRSFDKEGDIWKMVKNSEDAYIYDAVKKGVNEKLPQEIEKGIKDVNRRSEWEKTAPDKYALPTEIWREVVERRMRYVEIAEKIRKGQIRHINDFITYNLNIRRFAQDVIERSDNTDFVFVWWDALNKITILDPTCGSGAFLLAAINILEPLYDTCIARIQNPAHPNQKYFILKTIILKNIYGIDIMNEAVEIAKLRLFLKLVAAVEPDYSKPKLGLEPMPCLDTNIRCDNALFCLGGGFDVVIGNPPYVEIQLSKISYDLSSFQTQKTNNLHALCFERFNQLSKGNLSRNGVILPIGAFSTQNMEPLMNFIDAEYGEKWVSFYHFRPQPLFNGDKGANTATAILLAAHGDRRRFSTGARKFSEQTRRFLFDNMQYVKDTTVFRRRYSFCFPKIGSSIEIGILNKVLTNKPLSLLKAVHETEQYVNYRTAGGLYYKIIINFPFPYKSTSNKTIYFKESADRDVITAFLNSSLQWLIYTISFDTLNFTDYYIYSLPFSYNDLTANHKRQLHKLCNELMADYKKNAKHKHRGKTPCYEIKANLSKPIIDKIDCVLAEHYGFTNEELDYIINYDIKYRLH